MEGLLFIYLDLDVLVFFLTVEATFFSPFNTNRSEFLFLFILLPSARHAAARSAGVHPPCTSSYLVPILHIRDVE